MYIKFIYFLVLLLELSRTNFFFDEKKAVTLRTFLINSIKPVGTYFASLIAFQAFSTQSLFSTLN